MQVIKSIKAKYIPLLVVYFTTGLAGLSAVTATVFFKDTISLSAETLIELGVYIGLPWSIKMIFGSFIDSIKLGGNNRKSYIYLGQLLVFLGTLGMVDHTSTQYIFSALGEYAGLLLTGLTVTIGVVMSDIVADVMAIELVPEDSPNRDKELGMVQVLARLALALGGVTAALLTGYLASTFAASTVFSIELIGPVLAIVATVLSRVNYTPKVSPINRSLLLTGVGYGIFVVMSGMFLGQDIVFLGSLAIIIYMMKGLLKDFKPGAVRGFVLAMIAIFLFRVVPGIGPAGSWWYMNSLGFDESFMGTLRIIANVSGLVVLWFLANSITNHSIFKTMTVLIGLVTVLSLPDILVFYDLTGGLSARTVVLADTAMIAPLAGLSMIPLGVLIAKSAPEHARAAYISVTASLMNISLVGGDIITKYLNKIFVVTRDNFDQLGQLMIYSLIISTVLSIIGLVVLYFGGKNASSDSV
jgi:MFS family permease